MHLLGKGPPKHGWGKEAQSNVQAGARQRREDPSVKDGLGGGEERNILDHTGHDPREEQADAHCRQGSVQNQG